MKGYDETMRRWRDREREADIKARTPHHNDGRRAARKMTRNARYYDAHPIQYD